MKVFKKNRLCHISVLFFAVLLLAFLSFRLLQTDAQLKDLCEQLNISRETWEHIASEKEFLQTELSDLRNQIREAELTIAESRDKIISLSNENADLVNEINGLK